MPSFFAAAVTLPFDKSENLTFKLHGPEEKSCPWQCRSLCTNRALRHVCRKNPFVVRIASQTLLSRSTRTRQGESFLFRQIALSRQAIERRQHALQFTLGRKEVVIYLLRLIIRKTLDFFDQFVRAHELNLSPRGSLRKVRNASSSQS